MIELLGADTVGERASGVRVGCAFRVRGDGISEVHEATGAVIERTRPARLLAQSLERLPQRWTLARNPVRRAWQRHVRRIGVA